MKKTYLKMLLLMCFISSGVSAQIYVTQSGGGTKDGASWANAYDNTQLQQAINEAESATVKQVWVAKGTYKPTENLSTTGFLSDGTTPSTDRDKAFVMRTGVAIYGGFAGTESTVAERTGISTANETILSGDLGGNDIADVNDPGYAASKTDNAYHVVAANDDVDGAILAGFTIQDGYGDDPAYLARALDQALIRRNIGAGLVVFSFKTVHFKNLNIKNNKTANAGGGLYVRALGNDASINFENVNFENNEVDVFGGGAVYSIGDNGTSNVNFLSCNFKENKDTNGGTGGGVIYHANTILNVTDCNFENNSTTSYGGAIRLNGSVGNIKNSHFSGGIAGARGGAIYSTLDAILNIDNCDFYNNKAVSGGHIYVFSGTTEILNASLTNGESSGGGGAIYSNTSSILKLGNCLIKGNKAVGSGGAIYSSSQFSISRSKIYSNTTNGSGGALYSAGDDITSMVSNSIFYDNLSKTATTGGAGGGLIYHTRSTVGKSNTITWINNIFYANKAVNENGAYSFNSVVDVKINLYNNIFNANLSNWDETNQTGLTPTSVDIRRFTAAIQDYKNNIFQSSIATSGSRTVVNAYVLNQITPEPLFASLDKNDNNFLYPIVGGFAMDKGDNNLYTDNVEEISTSKDLLGYNARLNGTIIDLGAIEYSLVLPVSISSFTAKLNNNRTNLSWSVGTENNVSHYEVERSQNGLDFSNIAMVKANGSSAYSTTDNTPSLGVNYYRLKTVDKDGSAVYFNKVQSVNVAGLAASVVAVYPNPARDIVRVSGLAQGNYSYKLVNTAGATVQQGMLDAEASINVSGLKAGMYVLQLSNGSQLKVLKK